MLKILGVRISWRVVFQLALGLVYASPSLADWGESWGTLVWGAGVTEVPLLDWWGLYFLLIAVGLMGAYWARRTRQGLAVSLLVIVVVIPLAVAAGTVTVPNTFMNGTAADANEVNANFDAVETAVNDNDSRITALGVDLQVANDPHRPIVYRATSLVDPAPVQFGHGVRFGNTNPHSFAAFPSPEADNFIGLFYNHDGPGTSAPPPNPFEHAFNNHYETSYRASNGTGNHTWVEQNWNYLPPDNQNTPTATSGGWSPVVDQMLIHAGGGYSVVRAWTGSVLEIRQDFGISVGGEVVTDEEFTATVTGTFDPTVGTQVEFSGGASGIVVSWTDPTLVFKRASSRTTANSETVTGQAGDGGSGSGTLSGLSSTTETATLGTSFSYVGNLAGSIFRPMAHVWDTYLNRATWAWISRPDEKHSTLRIANNAVAIAWDGSVGGLNVDSEPSGASLLVGSGLGVGAGHARSNVGAIHSEFQSSGTSGLGDPFSTVGVGQTWALDLGGTDYDFNGVTHIRMATPNALGSGSTMVNQKGIWIFDQRGLGAAGTVIEVAAQTCDGSACTEGDTGNIAFIGGHALDGHLAFSGRSSDQFAFWLDENKNVFRRSVADAPGGDDDGFAFVTNSGIDEQGSPQWSISDASGSALHDTPAKVCEWEGANVGNGSGTNRPGVGGTCSTAVGWNLTAGAVIAACSTQVTNGNAFIAFCK
jgi:hypothetical protein